MMAAVLQRSPSTYFNSLIVVSKTAKLCFMLFYMTGQDIKKRFHHDLFKPSSQATVPVQARSQFFRKQMLQFKQ